MAFGLDESGFTLKRLADIRASLETNFRAEFGDSIRVGPSSIFGVLIGIVSGAIAPVWELAQAVWWALDPNQAVGAQLDRAAAILGLTRLAATFSQVSLDVSGAAGTVIPVGSQVQHSGTGALFETIEEVTIPDDGGGTGTISVAAQALESGPVEAASGSLTVIVTSITGWASVTNPLDAELGRDLESDPDLRIRIRESLEIAGSATVEAIKARIEELDGVISVLVVENDSGSVDAAGRPAHTFEAVVDGGDEDEIGNTIWLNKPAGIRSVSTGAGALAIEVNVIDSEGETQVIRFTRPELVSIWVDIVISGVVLTTEEEEEVIQAVLDEADTLGAGDDVRNWRLEKAASALPLIQDKNDQITSIEVFLGSGPGPDDYDSLGSITITEVQIADFDSTRTRVS